jgi:hypothetical protein
MRPQLFVITASLAACEPSNLLDEANMAVEGEASALVDAGYDAARREASDRARGLDSRLPDELDERVAREVDAMERTRPDCQRRATFAVRWSDRSDVYTGIAFSLQGHPLANIRGYHAPVRSGSGTFAGQWKLDLQTDSDPTAEPIETIDGHSTEDGNQATGPMGGVYTDAGRFIGAFSADGDRLPTRGIWKRLSDEGGIAIGMIFSCE